MVAVVCVSKHIVCLLRMQRRADEDLVILSGLWVIISNLSLTDLDVHLLLAGCASAEKRKKLKRHKI